MLNLDFILSVILALLCFLNFCHPICKCRVTLKLIFIRQTTNKCSEYITGNINCQHNIDFSTNAIL